MYMLKTYYYKQDPDNYEKVLLKLEKYLETHPNSIGGEFKYWLFIYKGIFATHQKEYDSAKKYLESSLKYYEGILLKSNHVTCLIRSLLSKAYTNTSDHKLAVATAEKAVKTFKRIYDKNSFHLGEGLQALAEAYYYSGQHQKACTCFEAAYQIFSKNKSFMASRSQDFLSKSYQQINSHK